VNGANCETGRSVTVGQWARSARSGHTPTAARFPFGRSRQQIEAAVAAEAQRHLATRAGAAGTGLGASVEQVLGIEVAQPVESERWLGAVAQQPLAPGAVGGRDAHRRID
jgi:hypothetical protein